MKPNQPSELNYNAYAYWWNMGKKTKDFAGTLKGLLESKHIKYRKISSEKGDQFAKYKFTTIHGVSYVSNFFDGAFTALKIYYAMMGDKATVNVQGRQFTINH